MGRTLTILIFLISLEFSVFAQTKIDEFPQIRGHDITSRLDRLFLHLQENPKSNALILVYSGSNRERFGNISGIISGTKMFESLRGFKIFPERISIVVAKGKTPLAQEYWLIGEGEKLPDFERPNTNFDKLEDKLLFAETSVAGEDEYGNLSGYSIDFNLLAEILINNPGYRLLVEMNREENYQKHFGTKPNKYFKKIRKLLSKKYKIKKKRLKFKSANSNNAEFGGYAKFYILPK